MIRTCQDGKGLQLCSEMHSTPDQLSYHSCKPVQRKHRTNTSLFMDPNLHWTAGPRPVIMTGKVQWLCFCSNVDFQSKTFWDGFHKE